MSLAGFGLQATADEIVCRVSFRPTKGFIMRTSRFFHTVMGGGAVLGLVTGTLVAGQVASARPGDRAETSTACSYHATRILGLSGAQGGNVTLSDTDGDQRIVGFSVPDNTPYPHGTLWHNGTPTEDWGPLMPVVAVNRSGVAIGTKDTNKAAFATAGGVKTELAKPAALAAGHGISARAISDDGLIVGSAVFTDNQRHAVAWSLPTAATKVLDLGPIGTARPFPHVPGGGLEDVDDTGGKFVGTTLLGTVKKAITGTTAGLTALGGVDPSRDSTATDIAGRFVLGTGTPIGAQTSSNLLWENGVLSVLPLSGTVTDVNSDGVVVGTQTASGISQAYVFRDGVRVTLPALAGYTHATASAVTADGRVLGTAWNDATGDQSRTSTGVVWSCE